MRIIRRLQLPARGILPRVPAQSFHLGRQDGTTRLSQDQTPSPVVESASDIAAKRLEFPRLVHAQNPLSVPKFRESYDKDGAGLAEAGETTLYGRVLSIRRHGAKLIFLTMVNEFERVQAMVSYKHCMKGSRLSMDEFSFFARLIERGDHISVTGTPTRSSTGELTLEAARLPELIAPVSEPIPEKLQEAKARAERRHVDMLVNQETTDVLRLRAYIIKYLRDYFHEKSFLEVQTPILGENAGGAIARPFTTTSTEAPSKELALRIAPELWLKRLIVGGFDKVFEIGPAFRNEGIDNTHNPEFTICEFYNAYANLEDLMRLTQHLIQSLAEYCGKVLIPGKLKSLSPISLAKFEGPFLHVELVPALEEALGFRFPDLAAEDAHSDLLEMLAEAQVELPGDPPATLSKLLDRLASIYIEPLSLERPVFIMHHPACMSPLAKSFICPRTGQLVSARTELFIDGKELANMYEEENDPVAQEQKLASYRRLGERSSEARLEMDLEAAPLDKSYVNAIKAGLPPTGGWGCGVERLVMLFSGVDRISACLSFGTLKNVVGLTSRLAAEESSDER